MKSLEEVNFWVKIVFTNIYFKEILAYHSAGWLFF